MELVAVLGKYYVTDFTFALYVVVLHILLQYFALLAISPHPIDIRVQLIFTGFRAGYFEELSSEHVPFAFQSTLLDVNCTF